jgi:hypothetical protein
MDKKIKELVARVGIIPLNDVTTFGMPEEKNSYYCKGYMLEDLVNLIVHEHLMIWHQMDNGNKVSGFIEMEDYPKAVIKEFNYVVKKKKKKIIE